MSQSGSNQLTIPVKDDDYTQGPNDAPVTMAEYGDYECSFCGEAYGVVKDAQQQLGDRLRFVFRNFPVTTSHPYAEQSAEAAEAAGVQGKFWQMHDFLYEHQDALGDTGLRHAAEQIGLDMDRFDQDLAEHRFADRVRDDFMSGVRSGVNGTPSFFINGTRFDESWASGNLLRALENAAG